HNVFQHLQRGGIGWRIGLACFAEYGHRFRNFFELAVLDLQNFRGLGNRHSWNRRRHVKQGAFVERRHEFAAKFLERKNREREKERSTGKRKQAMGEPEICKRW